MNLYLELNKNIQVNENQIDGKIDQSNKELVFQTFKEEIIKNSNSIISKLFYAIKYVTTQCNNCNKYIYNFQIYSFINFHLEEVHKYKIENINLNKTQNQINNSNPRIQMNNNKNELNILDCFDFEEKVNYMTGKNQMYCNYCKITNDCLLQTKLYTGPEILIIILNRGKGIEFNVKINFTEELNLSKYIENKETGYIYDLIGIITYLDKCNDNESSIAYCKDPLNGKWYKYNDTNVDEINDFKKEVIDFAIPYLLFYQKRAIY
jgi:ubiquitin C-terminal hydrolase